jgi:hypothetical protein
MISTAKVSNVNVSTPKESTVKVSTIKVSTVMKSIIFNRLFLLHQWFIVLYLIEVLRPGLLWRLYVWLIPEVLRSCRGATPIAASAVTLVPFPVALVTLPPMLSKLFFFVSDAVAN